MKTAYFDCFAGAGGDMIVAALVDAGADPDLLAGGLDGLGLGGFSLRFEHVRRRGFAATRFEVVVDPTQPQPHRTLPDIERILGDAAGLSPRVRDRAAAVFRRLAEAEAAVHGTTTDKIHFHEVGAVDAIVDVVGANLAIELLDIDSVTCSPIPVGSGTVRCAHGVIPVPAPATAELLKGAPLRPTEQPGELTTPTAAALLTTLAHGFGGVPAMTLETVGHGAGTREDGILPNLLRVLTGETRADGDVDTVSVLETNLDDASPQVIAHTMERLLNEGALDVFTVPIQMKKSRAGLLLTVLARPEDAHRLADLIFAETPTLGVRRHETVREKMIRRHETVATRFGPIRVKVGERGGVVTASPEFEDCRSAAETHRVAVRVVIAEANAAWSGTLRP